MMKKYYKKCNHMTAKPKLLMADKCVLEFMMKLPNE